MVAEAPDAGADRELPTLAFRMREHAGEAPHLYGCLMRAMADDWEAGGPVRDICTGWEHAPRGAVVQLRLLAGLFRIVLTGRAPQLERFYPCLGGTAEPADAWPAVRPVLATHTDELHDALALPPQTNEVGRSNALLVGIFAAVAHTGLSRVRLLEPGASAGLNLLADKFRFVNQDWSFGPEDSEVVLVDGIHGDVSPRDFTIVRRRGCDPVPLDISSPQARLRLRSFVWPFQVERHQRLSAALSLAMTPGAAPQVDRASAAAWLRKCLAEPADDDVLTVVWESITRLFWSPEEVAAVDEALAEAASHSAVAHVCMEYDAIPATERPILTVGLPSGSDGSLRTERLATVGDHGFPVLIGA